MLMILNNPVLLGLMGMLLTGGGEKKIQPEPGSVIQEKFFGVDPSSCEVIEFIQEDTGNSDISEVLSDGTPVVISAQQRLPDGTYKHENVAMLFDTSYPTEASGFETPNPNALRSMGKVLTVKGSKNRQAVPGDTGGKLELDFSAMNSITLKAVHVLDITEEDAGSKLELIDKSGKVFRTFELPITNTKGAFRLNTGNAKGVVKMRVVFGDERSQRGGGAIDVIEFCRD